MKIIDISRYENEILTDAMTQYIANLRAVSNAHYRMGSDAGSDLSKTADDAETLIREINRAAD